MPSASGAPVLYDSRTFAGMHLGASFHQDQTYDPDGEVSTAELASACLPLLR